MIARPFAVALIDDKRFPWMPKVTFIGAVLIGPLGEAVRANADGTVTPVYGCGGSRGRAA